MSLPINIEDLLRRNKVESNRVEFKRGWNPASIYHTICTFANDLDNLGGRYIIVGVEEENGMPKRPVDGVPTIIRGAMQYLKDVVIIEYVSKPKDRKRMVHNVHL